MVGSPRNEPGDEANTAWWEALGMSLGPRLILHGGKPWE